MLGMYDWLFSFALVGVLWMVVAIIGLNEEFIQRIQSWLMSNGEAATAAAGVAELLGGEDPEQVLATARKRFLCVSADRLLYDDMKENTPNPALGAIARKARLGHVTAFVSHSAIAVVLGCLVVAFVISLLPPHA